MVGMGLVIQPAGVRRLILLTLVSKLVLSKLSNDVVTPGEGVTYAILLTQPQRDTAAGAAITYRVEILPAFDDGMDKASLVTLP